MSAHILLTAELAQMVLEHLNPGPPALEDEPGPPLEDEDEDEDESASSVMKKERRECQHALAQLATVCRDVSWIALDVLWRHIDAVHHLLFALRSYGHHQHVCTFTSSNKCSLDVYRQHVRGLCVDDARSLHATVWAALTQRCPRGPLLPRLENLYRFRMNKSSPCYTMFMSPSLKRLGLTFCLKDGTEHSIIQMVVRVIQPSLRSIQHLALNDLRFRLPYEHHPTIPFWELTQLHTLQVGSEIRQGCALRMQELACLGSFQHLRTLRMCLANFRLVLGEPTATGMGFYSLRELKLFGCLGDICAFIVAAAPPSLELLSIHAHSLCDREDVEDGPHLQSVLPNGVRSLAPIYAKLTPSLRRFEANLECNCCGAHHFPDSDALLDPLRAAPKLRSISFVFKGTQPLLGNGTLPALQDEWPELAEFKFSELPPMKSSFYDEAPSGAVEPLSVQALGVFTHAHPHLTRLTVSFMDLRVVPDIATIPLLDHGLQHLSFSRLEDHVGLFPFALALDMLFPRLDVSGARSLTPHSQSWYNRNAELQLLLLALQTGRRIGAAGRADLDGSSHSKRPAGRGPPAVQVQQRPRPTLCGHEPCDITRREAPPVLVRGRGSSRSSSHSRSPSPAAVSGGSIHCFVARCI
ncbi:hypothetical protein C2E23DRAFT_733819 [Lenzites betulinus]|nr:hypothetical protein C2E23DRAFT_733819 [Lenzites betulinus]